MELAVAFMRPKDFVGGTSQNLKKAGFEKNMTDDPIPALRMILGKSGPQNSNLQEWRCVMKKRVAYTLVFIAGFASACMLILQVACQKSKTNDTPISVTKDDKDQKMGNGNDSVLPSSNQSSTELQTVYYVSSDTWKLQLSRDQVARLVEIISEAPKKKKRIQLDEEPLGHFMVGNQAYYWSGNALVKDEGDLELIWKNDSIQRMINRAAKFDYNITEENMKIILKKLDKTKGSGTFSGNSDKE